MEADLEDKLVPYALTWEPNVDLLSLDLDVGRDVEVLLVEDPDNRAFCGILNRSNQLAFGGPRNMGMPLWVMLDCAIVPSAMLGFMLARRDVPGELAELLDLDDDVDGWIPMSEYCACMTLEPGTVSGFSLHCHVAGQGIATRTKALALAALDARAQIGVTQFDNPAIRVHARFGPMEILLHRPSVHTHPDDSFVYRLELPGQDVLAEMAGGGVEFGVPDRPPGIRWTFDPDDEVNHGRLNEHLTNGGRAWIVSPGWRGTADGCEIDMILGE